MGKKQNRRTREKYPALVPHLNLRSRFELIDYDYIDQLSEKDKEWLNRFTEEYTNASFKHKGAKIHKKKKDELESYQRNNQRNNDILTRAKAAGKIYGLDVVKFTAEQLSPEDLIIQREELKEFISSKKVLDAIEAGNKEVKRLVEEIKDKLQDYDVLLHEMKRGNNSSD
jgi:hypothetical protein